MDKTKILLQRVLTELKTIDDRIDRKNGRLNVFIGLRQGENVFSYKKEHKYTWQNIKEKLDSENQSRSALMKRATELRVLLAKANCETEVSFLGGKYTIAELIILKNKNQVYEKTLLDSMRSQLHQATETMNNHNLSVEKTAQNSAKDILGSSSIVATDKDFKAITEPYVKRHSLSLEDPLDLHNMIAVAEEKIETFYMQVDAVLSEVNATTFVEI